MGSRKTRTTAILQNRTRVSEGEHSHMISHVTQSYHHFMRCHILHTHTCTHAHTHTLTCQTEIPSEDRRKDHQTELARQMNEEAKVIILIIPSLPSATSALGL